MGIYAYCLVAPGLDPPAELRGLGGEPVRRASVAGVDLWIGAQDSRPAPSVERMRTHNAVVTEALELGWTPLPFRFGQWLEGRAALEKAIGDRTDELAAALRRVKGAVEYGVRVLDPSASERHGHGAEAVKETTGREFMRRLSTGRWCDADRNALHLSVAAALREAAGTDLVDWRESTPQTTHGVLAVAHLVTRSRGEAYLERVRGVRARFPALRFLFSGPWPPYSFGPERGAV